MDGLDERQEGLLGGGPFMDQELDHTSLPGDATYH